MSHTSPVVIALLPAPSLAPSLTTSPISSGAHPPQSIPAEPYSTKALSVPLGPTTVAFTLDELHIWRPRVCTGSLPALLHAHTAAHTAMQHCYCDCSYCDCCYSSLRLGISEVNLMHGFIYCMCQKLRFFFFFLIFCFMDIFYLLNGT